MIPLRAPPMAVRSPDRTAPEIIAFLEDPDGYRVEVVQLQPDDR